MTRSEEIIVLKIVKKPTLWCRLFHTHRNALTMCGYGIVCDKCRAFWQDWYEERC